MNDHDLTPVERELVAHCVAGTECNLSSRAGNERRVRAKVLYELCVGRSWAVHAKGVFLVAAKLDEPLDFQYATFQVPLLLVSCDIKEMVLTSARSPAIEVIDCQIRQPLNAEMMRAGHLSLHGSTAEALDVAGAAIEGHLGMIGTKLVGIDAHGNSLTASGLHVTDAFLRHGFEAAGPIDLVGASIDGDLDLSGATLRGTADGYSLIANGTRINAAYLRHGFEAAGGVNVVGASVDRELDLGGAKLRGAGLDGNSLNADRLRTGGGVALHQGFEAAGVVSFTGAAIEDVLHIGETARIGGLRLTGARCGRLADDRDSWPLAGRLELRGFRFGALSVDTGLKERLDWVRRQPADQWSTDPYEQLAAYYSGVGDEDAARRMRIAKNDDELDHLKKTRKKDSRAYRFWRRPFGWLVGYGYRRWPAGVLLMVTVAAAAGTFFWAEREDAMVPNEPIEGSAGDPLRCGEAYPCFNSWIYGADVVLPIIDFGQDAAWRPVEASSGAHWWIWARWAFIAIGWALGSVFVAAFTALVQRS